MNEEKIILEHPDGMLPETIDCPHCSANMTLDEQERIEKRFACPACSQVIDFAVDGPAPAVGPAVSAAEPASARVRPAIENARRRTVRTRAKAPGINYFALVCVAGMAVSVFLPWVHPASGPMVSGIRFGAGLIVLILAFAGGIVTLLNKTWGAIAGALNTVMAFGFIFWWFRLGGYNAMNIARGGLPAGVPTPPQVGLYLLLIASVSFIAAVVLGNHHAAKKSDPAVRGRRVVRAGGAPSQ